MLAQKNEFISEASATIYQLSQEEKIRLQCEAREDFYRQQKDMQHVMKKLSSENRELTSQNRKLTSNNQELTSQNQKLSCKNQELTSEHEKLLAWAREHGYESGGITD